MIGFTIGFTWSAGLICTLIKAREAWQAEQRTRYVEPDRLRVYCALAAFDRPVPFFALQEITAVPADRCRAALASLLETGSVSAELDGTLLRYQAVAR